MPSQSEHDMFRGKQNDAADILSRGGQHADNWSLIPIIVETIWDRFGKAQVDLFAAMANFKCPLLYSLSPSDEPPMGLNALGQRARPGRLLYAFPPHSLQGDLMVQVLPSPLRGWHTGLLRLLLRPTAFLTQRFPGLLRLHQGRRHIGGTSGGH